MTHYESHPTSVMNIDVTSQKLRWCIDHIISTILVPEICTETIPFTGLSGCSFPPDDFTLATENHPANLCACAPLWYQRTQRNMLENHENIMKHVVCASLRILPCCHPWSPPNTTSLLHYPGSMRHFQCQLHAKLGHHTKLPTASKALYKQLKWVPIVIECLKLSFLEKNIRSQPSLWNFHKTRICVTRSQTDIYIYIYYNFAKS